ncbi:MAG: DUF2726 domain-containing protein [Pseudomonadota bacterium]
MFAGTCVLVAFGIRAWRRRERAAFHQVDAQVLSDLRQKAGVRADEVVPMEISPGLSSATDPVGAKTSAVPSPVSYETRQQVLDDVRRAFLSTLQPLLAKRGRTGVLVQVPLGTLVRSDDPQDRALRTHVAFVMYQLKDFAPLCVVEIKGSGAQEAARLSQLRNVLGTAGLPLVEFPMLDRYGRSELITELRAYL